MYFCKSKNHVWSNKKDAQKCCNGYNRIIVFGSEIPPDTKNIHSDEKSGVKYSRVWVKADFNTSENQQLSA